MSPTSYQTAPSRVKYFQQNYRTYITFLQVNLILNPKPPFFLLNIVNIHPVKCCKLLKNQHNVNMNQFGLGNFLNKFANYPFQNQGKGGVPLNAPPGEMPLPPANNMNPVVAKTLAQAEGLMRSFDHELLANMRMNNLSNFERSIYLKDLMNLPKEMEEVFAVIQNQSATTEETAKLLTKTVNIATIAEFIQANGKEAMNKLILVMSNASKQGMNDLSQIKDAMKLINASVSVASQDNPNQVLKSFMLLYLPWLPLREGVDFELEIESSEGGGKDSQTSITILISTKNFGNVKVVLVLLGINSIDLLVTCSEKFPKDELLKRIKSETKSHSLQSNVTFEQKEVKKDENATPRAKVSMSQLNEVNPFLLLMANAVIRHTIDLDNLAG